MYLFNTFTDGIMSFLVCNNDDGGDEAEDRQKIFLYAQQGLELSLWTFGLTILLEVWSLDTVQKVLKQKGAGWSLYIAAIIANIRNHFVLGVPIYTAAAYLFCYDNYSLPNNDDNETDGYSSSFSRNNSLNDGVDHATESQSTTVTSSDRLTSVASILFVQSVCFYAAHRAFHSNPNWYQHHRFHHRFNTHVPPMAANAVSPVEYIFAYILPFTLILPILKVDSISLRIVVSIVSITNLMIHTPKLSAVSEKFMPEWLVSTEDHLEHHRKLNTKYAAPTFNVDYFVDLIEQRFFGYGGDDDGSSSNNNNGGTTRFGSNGNSNNGSSAVGMMDPMYAYDGCSNKGHVVREMDTMQKQKRQTTKKLN